jgi:hypothetical protein
MTPKRERLQKERLQLPTMALVAMMTKMGTPMSLKIRSRHVEVRLVYVVESAGFEPTWDVLPQVKKAASYVLNPTPLQTATMCSLKKPILDGG